MRKERERDFLGYPVHENWIERNAYLFPVGACIIAFVVVVVKVAIVVINE